MCFYLFVAVIAVLLAATLPNNSTATQTSTSTTTTPSAWTKEQEVWLNKFGQKEQRSKSKVLIRKGTIDNAMAKRKMAKNLLDKNKGKLLFENLKKQVSIIFCCPFLCLHVTNMYLFNLCHTKGSSRASGTDYPLFPRAPEFVLCDMQFPVYCLWMVAWFFVIIFN
jgi:hypothetical protein